MKSITIEKVSKENLNQLTELILELWTDSFHNEELENCETILNSKEQICFLAKDHEVYIGFIHLTLRNDYVEGSDNSPTAYVEALYVKEPYRKFGIAKKLLVVGEEWAKQKNCKQLASDTEIHNSGSIEFHKKVGFYEVNKIVCFMKNL